MSSGPARAGQRQTAALLVLHREGDAADAVRRLKRHFRAPSHALGVFAAGVVAEGTGLEKFMREVPAAADMAVIHVLPTASSPSEAAPISLDIERSAVDAVGEVDVSLKTRFPALRDIDSWVVVDLGRSWSQSAGEVAQALIDISEKVRLRGVAAVTGSTAATVAGSYEDRLGMLIDVSWDLATSPLGDIASDRVACRVWAVGSQSFTLDSHAWVTAAVSPAVAEVIGHGPLQPAREGVLDQAKSRADRWLSEQLVGTEHERTRLMAAAHGSAMDALVVRRTDVASVAPSDWAAVAEQEYLRLSGAPLSRFTRVVNGNARDLLDGREGSAKTGLKVAFDAQLVELLRSPTGCLRSSRFLNAVASRLSALQSAVASLPHINPVDVNLEDARNDLDSAVRSLPGVLPWLVRTLLAALVTAVLVQDRGGLIAALAPAAVTLLLTLEAWRRRRHALRCRDAYIAAIEHKVQGIAWQRLIAVHVDLLKGLLAHVGAYLDDHDTLVDMEVAQPPAANTRAADVMRIWLAFKRLRGEYSSTAPDLLDFDPVHPHGKFFRVFPSTPNEFESVRGSTTPLAREARNHVVSKCEQAFRQVELDWDHAGVSALARDACDSASREYATTLQLNAFDPHLLKNVVAQLSEANGPMLDSTKHNGAERVALVLPEGLEGDAMRGLSIGPTQRVGGSDLRRLSLVWWSEQNFSPTRAQSDPPGIRQTDDGEQQDIQAGTLLPGGGV